MRRRAPGLIRFLPPLGAAGKREVEALDWVVFSLGSEELASQNRYLLPEIPPLPRGNFRWREKFASFRAGAGSPETVRAALQEVAAS